MSTLVSRHYRRVNHHREHHHEANWVSVNEVAPTGWLTLVVNSVATVSICDNKTTLHINFVNKGTQLV